MSSGRPILPTGWRAIEIDWAKGRLYVPASIWQSVGAREVDLSDRRITAEWRRALADVTARTRALFSRGAPVADGVRGRLRWELRATWLGGMRILDVIVLALGAAGAPDRRCRLARLG